VFAVVVAVDQFLAPRTSHRYDLSGRQREHGSLGQWETPFQDQVEKSIWLRWSLTLLLGFLQRHCVGEPPDSPWIYQEKLALKLRFLRLVDEFIEKPLKSTLKPFD